MAREGYVAMNPELPKALVLEFKRVCKAQKRPGSEVVAEYLDGALKVHEDGKALSWAPLAKVKTRGLMFYLPDALAARLDAAAADTGRRKRQWFELTLGAAIANGAKPLGDK